MEPVEQSSPGSDAIILRSIGCSCGARLVDQVAPQFEAAFPLPPGESIEAAAFVQWHDRVVAAVARPGELPLLHQVWLQRSDSPARMGRAVYFESGGEQYSVFASLSPTLVARKLPFGWLHGKLLPAQRQSTGYVQQVIPRLEDAPPGWTLPAPDADGNISIPAHVFESLFAGTGVTLESYPFTTVFQRELQEFVEAAAHARSCAGPLRLYHV